MDSVLPSLPFLRVVASKGNVPFGGGVPEGY